MRRTRTEREFEVLGRECNGAVEAISSLASYVAQGICAKSVSFVGLASLAIYGFALGLTG